MKLQRHQSASPKRVVTSASVANLDELRELESPSRNFILFIAADTRDKDELELESVAEALIGAGASYVCCWGPGCKRLHDCFDEADASINGPGKSDRTLVTTWHDEEPLQEALWFAVNTAWPAYGYESTTAAVVAVSVNSEEWSRRITAYLDAGAPAPDNV